MLILDLDDIIDSIRLSYNFIISVNIVIFWRTFVKFSYYKRLDQSLSNGKNGETFRKKYDFNPEIDKIG